jgi:hypothetical protein
MRDKLIDILWELDNHKYPNYEDKADEILSLFNVVVPKGTLCRSCKSDDVYSCFLTDVKVCNKCYYQD